MSPCRTCEEAAIDFLYEEMDREERLRFADHLSSSPPCAEAVRALEETERRTRRSVTEEPSPALLAGLKAEARKQVAELRASRDHSVRLTAAPSRVTASRPAGLLARIRSLVSRRIAFPVWVPALGALVLVAAASLVARREGKLAPAGATVADERAVGGAPSQARPAPAANAQAPAAPATTEAPARKEVGDSSAGNRRVDSWRTRSRYLRRSR